MSIPALDVGLAYGTKSASLVVNSNFSTIFHRFGDTATYRLKKHIFPTTPLFDPQI